MKLQPTILKILFLFLLFSFSQLSAVTFSDDFESATNNGWVDTQGVSSPGGGIPTKVLELSDNNISNYKTYYFTAALGGEEVTVTLDLYGTGGGWEDTDGIFIFNFSENKFVYYYFPNADAQTDPLHQQITFIDTIPTNGFYILLLYPTNLSSEKTTYVDNITVESNTPLNLDGYRDFESRYQASFPGKMTTIGNTILVAPEDQSSGICDNNYTNAPFKSNAPLSNDNYELCSYYADNSVNFPTTKETLPSSISGSDAKVVWAGLYWQSLVENNDSAILTNPIKLKHQNALGYTSIIPTIVDDKENAIIAGYTNYAAFADVTNYFQDNNFTGGEISVGDIPVAEGKIDLLGAYGAWMLVVVYSDPAEILQNYSIYDGWTIINSTRNIVEVPIGGFYTPKNAAENNTTTNAQISVFTAEGDAHIVGDSLNVKPSKKTVFTELTNNFDSTITPATLTRMPNLINNQGIDIHTYELGTSGEDIIEGEESIINLQFTSVATYDNDGKVSQDTYWPSVIAFSSQLYAPKICYDYTASIGDSILFNLQERDINTTIYSDLPLKIEFLIYSEEADFTYINAKANIDFLSSSHTLTYNNDYAEMSPPFVNSYYPYTTNPEIEHNASKGQLSIGADVIGNLLNTGGTIIPKNITYAKLGFDITKYTDPDKNKLLTTHFDIEFDAQIEFTPGMTPVDFSFTTHADKNSSNHIPRCDNNATYNPIHLGFNVERKDAPTDAYTLADPNARYTLHTQVTGRPYQIDIVAYDGGVATASNTPDIDYDNAVELELIDADAFGNNANAGYDTTCQRPASIGEGQLLRFHDESRHTVDVPNDWDGYLPNHALRNAAYRLWILTKVDGSGEKVIVPHKCELKDNSDHCFTDVYNDEIKDVNNTLCDANADCGDNNSPGCYQCLKNNYATAICSRDNFSIRPDSYAISIYDDNDADNAVVTPTFLKENTNIAPVNLSAGYLYKLDINTTAVGGASSTGYYGLYNNTPLSYDPTPNPLNSGTLALQEFKSAGDCNDISDYAISNTIYYNDALLIHKLYFSNGSISPSTHMMFDNVGEYDIWFADSNWTIVDQGNKYGPYRTVDCVIDSSNSVEDYSLAGCAFTSEKGTRTLIKASVKPYKFDLTDIDIDVYPNNKNYTYFNDFSHSYYDTNPINNASATIQGLLFARGKHTGRTSNFTTACVAEDVAIITLINADSVEGNSSVQQYLKYIDANGIQDADNVLGNDKNLTLPKEAFPSSSTIDGNIAPGNAKIRLYTTLKKATDTPSNPIITTYKEINASSQDANSNTGLDPAYVPKGGTNLGDQEITYFFAKITPERTLYDNVSESSKLTPLYVDIYCSLDAINVCDTIYNLDTPTKGQDEDNQLWYSATGIFDSNTDGDTSLGIYKLFGEDANPNVTEIGANDEGIEFEDTDVSQQDINVSLGGPGRPSTVDITIKPVPWLLFNPDDPDGYPHYRIKFIGDSTWSGIGATGFTTEATSNNDANAKRLNW